MDILQKSFEDNNQVGQDDVGTGGLKYLSERHVACVFLLDTSRSMSGDAIDKLNQGLQEFKNQTMSNTTLDEHTKSCIDVALISFGSKVLLHTNGGEPVRRGQDFDMASVFVPVSSMNPPVLRASGGTPMGEAIDWALDIVGQQKKRYNDFGTPYYRPWVFCITDGEPTDDYKAAAQKLKEMEADNKVLGYCVGVADFKKDTMANVFDTARIFELANLDFPGLFKFVSNSLDTVRNSDPTAGNQVDVAAPSTLTMAF
ncbi:MAG: VWA domain-containing protein [Candidatus Bathyarchaeota archaeon]|nr:VWA domain-containing protein [Candidatus Termiticorpusculum sp.]MCL2868834.1 VWA domain-containing protein [Candidatus Termiticorpusculum sp.]